MKNKPIGIPRLFVALSLALAGLMILQVLLLKYAWDLKEQAFTRGVQSAVSATVLSLESREIEGTAYEFFFNTSITNDQSLAPTRYTAPAAPAAPAEPPRVRAQPSRSRRLRRHDIRRVERHGLHFGAPDSLVVVVENSAVPGGLHYIVQPSEAVDIRRVVGNWITRAPVPIRERLNVAEINEVLVDELLNLGIDVEPGFGVVRPETGRMNTFFVSTGSGKIGRAHV